MITVLQTGFALLVIILIILFVFKPKRKEIFVLPEHYKDLLRDYVLFYANLEETEKETLLTIRNILSYEKEKRRAELLELLHQGIKAHLQQDRHGLLQ